jgi:hypothetical protein
MNKKFVSTALGIVLAVTISGCANTTPVDGDTPSIEAPITEVTGEGGVLGAGIGAPIIGEKITVTGEAVNAPVTDGDSSGGITPAPATVTPQATPVEAVTPSPTEAAAVAPVEPVVPSAPVQPVAPTPVEVTPSQAPVVTAPERDIIDAVNDKGVVTGEAEKDIIDAIDNEGVVTGETKQEIIDAIDNNGVVTGEPQTGVGTSRTVTSQGNGLFLCEDGDSLFYSGDCLATWNSGKGEVPRGAAITPKGAMSSVGVVRNTDGSFDCTQNIVVIGFAVPDCAAVFTSYNGGK